MNRTVHTAFTLAAFLAAFDGRCDERPRIDLPPELRRLGVSGDRRCAPEPEPCFRITAKGTVSPDLHAYFAVEPLDDPASVMWLMPIPSIDSDGTVREVIQFGEAGNGAGQEFAIRLLGCRDPRTLDRKHTITSIPQDCISSDVVTLYRIR